MKQVEQHPRHPFRARAFVALIMLALSFIGLVITDVTHNGAFLYWQIMVPIFAVLCIGLSFYIRSSVDVFRPVTIWHEILHWIGLCGAVSLIWFYVDLGTMGRFEAGLVILTLLALTVFLIGIYVDYAFIIIGLMLGVFAGSAALVEEYLFTVMLPLTIIVGFGLYFYIHSRHKKAQASNDQ